MANIKGKQLASNLAVTNVTASGHISSSATITSQNSIVKNDLTVGGNLDIADTIFHTGDSNTKIRFPAVDTVAFHTSGLERLRITSDGKISGSSVSTGSFGRVEIGAGGIDTAGDITLDGDGGDIILKDGGVEYGRFTQLLGGLTIKSGPAGIAALVIASASANPSVIVGGEITTAHNISGSSTTTGSFGNIEAHRSITAADISASVIQASQGTIDIHSLSGYVANEHIDHSGVSISAGGILSGGGDITTNRTITLASSDVVHDSTSGFVANEHIDHSSVTITAGSGLTGGGTIASTRTLAVGQGTGVTVNANDVAIGQAVETDSNVQFANITATATASLAKISGSLIESTGDFTLNSSGDIILDADGTDVILKDGGTSFGSFKRASSDFIIKAETADKDILFKGTDDSTTITALQLDMSEGGNAQFLGNISGSQIEASGDVIAFGSSDRNLKDNIQPIENPLEKMDKIGGYTFVWNDKQSTYKGKDIGVVAQEIQEIMPEIVATRANGYLGVKYEKIVPLLIESIKELKKEVEDIKQKCDCLNK